MNDIVHVLVMAAFGLCLGAAGAMVGNILYLTIWKWPKEEGKVPFARLRRKPKNMAHPGKVQFCGSCGARMILNVGQLGFHSRTGEPRKLDFLACPDYDDALMKTMPSIMTFGDFRECGKVKHIPIAPVYAHGGHLEGDVAMDCPRCIIDMERAEIISHDDATRRLGEIA